MPRTLQHLEIEIDRIDCHPDNLRKDLGDLTELAAGIKEDGVYQNLTIIPQDEDEYIKKVRQQKKKYEGRYTVVMGNRRLEAAKLAGLTTVPCTIAMFDQKKQIQAMLIENCQRVGLTKYEEAEGYQMLLDLGDTVSVIAEKTGFSANTIKQRTNLLQYNKETVIKSFEKGATLDDYQKLEKIKDPAVRQAVQKNIGTNNFDWTYKQAIRKQTVDKEKPKWLEILKTFAAKITSNNTSGYRYIERIDISDDKPKEYKIPKDAGTVKYFYIEYDSSFGIYAEAQAQESAEDTKLIEEREAAENTLKRAFNLAYSLRLEFAKKLKPSSRDTETIHKMINDAIFNNDHLSIGESAFKAFYGIKGKFRLAWQTDKAEETFSEALTRIREEYPELTIAFAGAYLCCDSKELTCVNYDGITYHKSANLERLYERLEALGYEMSDEEKSLIDGTHESYFHAAESDPPDDADDHDSDDGD